MDCEENRIWAREMKALTIEIQNRLKNFDLSVGEEENLLQLYKVSADIMALIEARKVELQTA